MRSSEWYVAAHGSTSAHACDSLTTVRTTIDCRKAVWLEYQTWDRYARSGMHEHYFDSIQALARNKQREMR